MLRKFQGHGCEEKCWGWGIQDQDTTQKLTEEGNIMCKTAGAEQEVNTKGGLQLQRGKMHEERCS